MNDKRVPDSFYEIKAYTNGYVIIVEGEIPDNAPETGPLVHNCDEMGCGIAHVVVRIPILEPTPELEWARLNPPPPLVPSWEEDK